MIDALLTIGPPLLVFSGIVIAGACQFIAREQGPTITNVSGATAGCGLIVLGFSLIVG